MPGMYQDNDYDLAGFCVGVVERRNIIDGAKIAPGDALIGLESNGIHSNGYSLVRRVLSRGQLKELSAELLRPTRIYVKPVLSLLRLAISDKRLAIKGIAHITGGAFYDKIARILPANVNARIYKDSWAVPKIFRFIQNKGGIEEKEMYHTFNMGVGMVLITGASAAKKIVAELAELRLKAWVIGGVTKGSKTVELV
jgi:phosphoribosylformylglycinamidine cyclo-ligase